MMINDYFFWPIYTLTVLFNLSPNFVLLKFLFRYVFPFNKHCKNETDTTCQRSISYCPDCCDVLLTFLNQKELEKLRCTQYIQQWRCSCFPVLLINLLSFICFDSTECCNIVSLIIIFLSVTQMSFAHPIYSIYTYTTYCGAAVHVIKLLPLAPPPLSMINGLLPGE